MDKQLAFVSFCLFFKFCQAHLALMPSPLENPQFSSCEIQFMNQVNVLSSLSILMSFTYLEPISRLCLRGGVVAAFVVLQSHGCVLRPTLVPRVWKTLPRNSNLGVPALSPEPSSQWPLNKCCCKEGACQLQRKLKSVVKVWGSTCEKWKMFQISFCLAVLLTVMFRLQKFSVLTY